MAKKAKAKAAARRRQAKQRRDKRRTARPHGGDGHSGPQGFDPFFGATGTERAVFELESVLMLIAEGDNAGADSLTRRIAATYPGQRSRPHIEALAEILTAGVKTVWRRGWRPAEVVRQARRLHRRNTHESLAAAAILGQARDYSTAAARFDDAAWQEQLVQLFDQWSWGEAMKPALESGGPSAWLDAWLAGQGTDLAAALRCALEVAVTLRRLPPIEVLGPYPGSTAFGQGAAPGASSGLPAKLLERVRALLAKAESTNYPDEAAAFTAKAQEIMSRHAIDSALLGSRNERDREKPSMRRLDIDDPYAQAKAVLLQVVCDANRARTVWSKELGFSSVVGFSADLDIVEILFGSLLVQSTSAMLEHGSRRSAYGHNDTTAFRRSFMESYANRIGQRLQRSAQAAVDAAAAASGADLLPVLASRQDEVDQAMAEAFPHIVQSQTTRRYHREGHLAGKVAADLADLSLFDELVS